jgi:hypothetical protein
LASCAARTTGRVEEIAEGALDWLRGFLPFTGIVGTHVK